MLFKTIAANQFDQSTTSAINFINGHEIPLDAMFGSSKHLQMNDVIKWQNSTINEHLQSVGCCNAHQASTSVIHEFVNDTSLNQFSIWPRH